MGDSILTQSRDIATSGDGVIGGHHRKGNLTEFIGNDDIQPIKLSFDNRVTARISESLADIYGINEAMRGFNTKDEEAIHRFIYELEDPLNPLETLDNLDR